VALSTDDKREIRQLLVRYTWFIDSYLPEREFFRLFTDDAVLSSPSAGRFEGQRGLAAFLAYRKDTPSWGPDRAGQLRHLVSNALVEGAGDTAFMRAFLVAVSTPTDGENGKSEVLLAGHYECDVVRVGGVWKLKSRIEVADTAGGEPADRADREPWNASRGNKEGS
jgi:hypothetical protein